MEININSPSYYKTVHGIDNEIYRFCQAVYMHFKDKKYSDLIDVVGIIPIIAPDEKIENGEYKEIKKCSVAYRFADVRLRIDYDLYVSSDIEGKKSLMAKNILDSIKVIRAKGKIDYDRFEKDFLKFCKDQGVKVDVKSKKGKFLQAIFAKNGVSV